MTSLIMGNEHRPPACYFEKFLTRNTFAGNTGLNNTTNWQNIEHTASIPPLCLKNILHYYASRRSRTRDTVKLTVCVCVRVCVRVSV